MLHKSLRTDGPIGSAVKGRRSTRDGASHREDQEQSVLKFRDHTKVLRAGNDWERGRTAEPLDRSIA
jgi:hypothetical protein